jgi:RNA polymerase sigma factor (TIGR02999 family)
VSAQENATAAGLTFADLPAYAALDTDEQEALTRWLGDSTVPTSSGIDAALPQLYDELRAIAGGYLRHERPDHTLQPTALVHESYLRLRGQQTVDWSDRLQFLSIAARMMRRILANYAAARNADKRGAGMPKIELDAAVEVYEQRSTTITAVDEALNRLEQQDARQAKIVELRFFGGMTAEEISTVLNTSPRTVDREWAVAKRWLRRELQAA